MEQRIASAANHLRSSLGILLSLLKPGAGLEAAEGAYAEEGEEVAVVAAVTVEAEVLEVGRGDAVAAPNMRPIQRRTPAMSDQHSDMFEFSSAVRRERRRVVVGEGGGGAAGDVVGKKEYGGCGWGKHDGVE